ncbi:hypothetical protein ACFPK9_04155 [Rubritalea spongiae]|uniref:N-acetyltransferase domain-containing protein n=1 Tax=Rubritalea spongiae TaxID=430797 RepID=A0ABW5E4D5_9BACT
MNILNPNSNNLSKESQQAFLQGASYVIESGLNSAALWLKNIPAIEGETVATLGNCYLDKSSNPTSFLTDCIDWLHKNHQITMLIGPMNGNTWLKHRLIIETDESPPFLMEPMEPQFYYNAFEQSGFKTIASYCSHRVDLTKPQADHSPLLKRIQKKGISIRPLNMDSFESDLKSIFKLSLESFQQNFLYTPIKEEVFLSKYLESKKLVDPALVLLAERDNELVAYLFCIPDHAARQYGKQPAIILKTLASKPDKALAGIGHLLVSQAHSIAKNKGYTEAIHALQHEDNEATRISERFQATKFRRYALMSKTLK